MKHYYRYWPVLAIIKQYLSNRKKWLAQDLKAEHDDPGLPGSNKSQNKAHKMDEESEGDSSHITKAKGLKTASKKCHLNGSGKGLGVEVEELEDKELEDKELEDKELEDKELEDEELEDKELEDKELEDEELEDKELEDKELEDKELEDKELEDKELEDKELEDKELEDEELEEVEEVEGESDDDEVKEDDEDGADLEDDKAEMEICESYGGCHGALGHNDKEDGNEIPPVKKSVEYHLFLTYLSLTWTLYCK